MAGNGTWVTEFPVSPSGLTISECLRPCLHSFRGLRTEEYTRAEIERYTVPTEVIFSPSIDYEGYLSTHLAYDLDMENRLRVGPALPELRREIEVVTVDGALGVVTVPRITPTVTLATTEVTFDYHACFNYLFISISHVLLTYLCVSDSC